MSVAGVFQTRSNATRSEAYRQALRHSQWVRFLRLALPLVSFLALSGTLIFIYVDPFKPLPVNIDIGSLALDGSKITMEHANLRGFKDGDLPFTILATKAIQDVSTPYIMNLEGLTSDIAMPDRSSAKIKADTGVYDSQKDVLNVKGNVDIRTPRYTVLMQSGTIDFKTNRVVSREAVSVEMIGGTIDAGAMNVFDNGDRIQFSGKVRSKFRRSGDNYAKDRGVGVSK
jgi:lipopolysaccharide export system protein LptC